MSPSDTTTLPTIQSALSPEPLLKDIGLSSGVPSGFGTYRPAPENVAATPEQATLHDDYDYSLPTKPISDGVVAPEIAKRVKDAEFAQEEAERKALEAKTLALSAEEERKKLENKLAEQNALLETYKALGDDDLAKIGFKRTEVGIKKIEEQPLPTEPKIVFRAPHLVPHQTIGNSEPAIAVEPAVSIQKDIQPPKPIQPDIQPVPAKVVDAPRELLNPLQEIEAHVKTPETSAPWEEIIAATGKVFETIDPNKLDIFLNGKIQEAVLLPGGKVPYNALNDVAGTLAKEPDSRKELFDFLSMDAKSYAHACFNEAADETPVPTDKQDEAFDAVKSLTVGTVLYSPDTTVGNIVISGVSYKTRKPMSEYITRLAAFARDFGVEIAVTKPLPSEESMSPEIKGKILEAYFDYVKSLLRKQAEKILSNTNAANDASYSTPSQQMPLAA